MDTIIAQIKGWQCSNTEQCRYFQDTDPNNPFQQSDGMFPDVPLGKCPNCYGKYGEFDLMPMAADSPAKMTVLSDADLEAQQVPVLDDNGNQVFEQSGQTRYEFNPFTGEVSPVPVMVPKMRPLTDQELAGLKAQRDQNLDALESVAVSSTTATTSTDTTTPTDQPSITI